MIRRFRDFIAESFKDSLLIQTVKDLCNFLIQKSSLDKILLSCLNTDPDYEMPIFSNIPIKLLEEKFNIDKKDLERISKTSRNSFDYSIRFYKDSIDIFNHS